MKRAEITEFIENHHKITEKEIQSLLKEHSQNIERSLIDYLKTDQEELLKDITDHRKKMRVLLSQELKKQMTMKIRTINIKIQTALISIVSLNLFLTILIIIRMVVRY